MSDAYKIYGGSGDGNTLARNKIPPLEDGATIDLDAGFHEIETYRRVGDTLVFVSGTPLVTLVGGPFDGTVQPWPVQAPPERTVVIAVDGTDTYAWYERDERDPTRAAFTGTSTRSELEPLDE